MDLILGAYAQARLADLPTSTLDRYEALLDENDQDLYLWVSGAAAQPAKHREILTDIAAFHGILN